jgi:hypothetical protein
LNKDIKYYIKSHPSISINKIMELCDFKFPENFIIANEKIDYYFQFCKIMISNTSSACVEAIVWGIPVIIIGSTNSLTQNPIPNDINKDIWRVCYTYKELKEAIQEFSNFNEEKLIYFKNIGNTVKINYFEPVTEQGVKKFLHIDN